MDDILEQFRSKITEKKKIDGALSILQWDLETCTPKKGQEFLSEIVGYLTMKGYEISTSKEFVELLDKLKSNLNSLSPIDKKEVEIISEEIEKMKHIPSNEYQYFSELVVKAQGIWEQAKLSNNYKIYEDKLQEIFDYTLKFAKYNRKNEANLYDVVLNEYEKGMTTEKLDIFFESLKEEIVPLLQKIVAKGNPKRKLNFYNSIENQKKFNRKIGEYLGFDFDRGVVRESEHPFTLNVDKNDVRLTTKYVENTPFSAIFSTIHETGHGIYEQQIGDELKGTILACGGSMGIHESQSRFYENIIGRSKAFWKGIYSEAQNYNPILKEITIDDFYKEINIVEPSLIRTEADELTYSLHIMVRYEIEKELFSGNIKAKDLPKIWNEKMIKYLGIAPKYDSQGVLQDVHWAGGLIGYFPSYALGSAYSVQIYNAMKKDMDIDKVLENDEMDKIKNWLGDKIHKYGRLKETEEIIREITGEGLNPKYYIDYLKKKYSAIYNLDI